MKNLTIFIAVAMLGLSAALAASPQETPNAVSASPFVQDFLGQVDFVEGRILALSKAMAGKEAWRPKEGVTSVGETYLHIAFGNYILLKQAGFEPPAAANFSMDMKKWDSQATESAKIADILKASFDHARSAAKKVAI